jgi:hemolysin activation/secretion protein
LGGDNEDAAFRDVRADAESGYAIGLAGLSRLQRLPGDWSLVVRADGQWSDAALLPSEQVGLGGFDAVRGYREREFLVDSGLVASAELRTPVWGWMAPQPLRAGAGSGLQALAFADYGRGETEGLRDVEVSSAGAGLRYQLGRNLELRFDYGWALDGSNSRAHLGVVASW